VAGHGADGACSEGETCGVGAHERDRASEAPSGGVKLSDIPVDSDGEGLRSEEFKEVTVPARDVENRFDALADRIDEASIRAATSVIRHGA
jgi:hypothetical protein